MTGTAEPKPRVSLCQPGKYLLQLLDDLWGHSSGYRVIGTFHSKRA